MCMPKSASSAVYGDTAADGLGLVSAARACRSISNSNVLSSAVVTSLIAAGRFGRVA
jgi:hypothetical protein